MTSVAFSPPASTSSHTLSIANSFATMDQQSPLSTVLFSTLSSNPHAFLQPPQNLHSSALALAKQFLDPLASGVTEKQAERQNEARRKRKRGQQDYSDGELLKMKKVHVDGFAVDQVWEQARRVLDAAREEVIRSLPDVEDEQEGDDSEDEESTPKQNGVKTVRFDDEGFEVADSEEDVGSEDEVEEEDEMEEDSMASEDALEDEAEDEDIESDDIGDSDEEEEEDGPAEEYVEDPNGLNDGFFSIDEFNKQTQIMEQNPQGEDDEDDEVDFFADPLAGGGVSLTNGADASESEEDEEEDEEGGPTFGNMDLDAPEGASDVDEDENDEDMDTGDISTGLGNANNILYADFYAPPAKKAGKNKKKRGRPNPHNFPAKTNADPTDNDGAKDETAEDIERTMAAVHRDLFSESDEDSDSEAEKADPGDPKSRRSTHERRKAQIGEEIRKLEAANVAKRPYTLMGEARATDRPLNSLLEEDLDFERAGKPVPVITAEVSEDIEALIKRRILASEFDELIRRRPDDLATGPTQRRGLVDLADTKSKKGLAEEYEEDHLKRSDPAYVSATDAKTKAAHDEIKALWEETSRRLDSLSSWHYRPKPAAPSLEVRVDAPALALEDARPTAGADIGSASQLAPQEVYKPGAVKAAGEVVTKSGMPVAREEMDREDKARRRRREKERMRKANANRVVTVGRDGKEVVKEKKGRREEKEVLGHLKKGGVKVIGKKGELTNVDGTEVSEKTARATSGSYKL